MSLLTILLILTMNPPKNISVFSLKLSESIPTLGSHAKILLRNFYGCHFKIFLSNSSEKSISSFLAFRKHLNFNNRAVVSLESYQFQYGRHYKSDNFSHHKHYRFLKCFVHAYMLNNDVITVLTSPTKTDDVRTPLQAKMHQSESSWEQPNYFIFVETPKETKKANKLFKINQIRLLYFYRIILPKTFAKGLVFGIRKLKEVYMVCMSCSKTSTIFVLQQSNLKNLSLLKILWTGLHANLNDKLIFTKMKKKEWKKPAMLGQCHGYSKKYRNSADLPDIGLCVHKLLSDKYNYTYFSFLSKRLENKTKYGIAENFMFINKNNLERIQNSRVFRWEWIPYGCESKTFQFIVVQPKSGIKPYFLILPFDWSTWMFVFFSGVSLICITALITKEFQLNVLLHFLSSLVEQQIIYVQQRKDLFCWLIWSVMLVVLIGGYKSRLFSVIIHEGELVCPETLQELVADQKIIKIFTMATAIYGGQEYSIFKVDVLGKTGDTEIERLNYATSFYPITVNRFVLEVLGNYYHKNLIDLNSESMSTTSFAVVDYEDDVNDISHVIRHFTTDYAVSKSIPVPRYIFRLPWRVSKNFFYPIFTNGVANLLEAGILDRIKIYRILKRKIILYSYVHRRLSDSNISVSNLKFGHDKPLSLREFGRTFEIIGVLVMTSILGFLKELLTNIVTRTCTQR